MNIKNKRGAGFVGGLVAVGVIAVLVVLTYAYWGNITDAIEIVPKTTLETPTSILKTQFSASASGPSAAISSGIGGILGVFIGKVPIHNDNPMGSLIVVFCLWIMFALLFGDIIKNFGAFDPKIAYVVGVLLATVTANLGMIHGTVMFFTSILAGLGVFAVYAGLGAAFLVFIALELGVTSLGPFLMRRKMMRHAYESEIKSVQGATAVDQAIQGMKKIGVSLKKKPSP